MCLFCSTICFKKLSPVIDTESHGRGDIYMRERGTEKIDITKNKTRQVPGSSDRDILRLLANCFL